MKQDTPPGWPNLAATQNTQVSRHSPAIEDAPVAVFDSATERARRSPQPLGHPEGLTDRLPDGLDLLAVGERLVDGPTAEGS